VPGVQGGAEVEGQKGLEANEKREGKGCLAKAEVQALLQPGPEGHHDDGLPSTEDGQGLGLSWVCISKPNVVSG